MGEITFKWQKVDNLYHCFIRGGPYGDTFTELEWLTAATGRLLPDWPHDVVFVSLPEAPTPKAHRGRSVFYNLDDMREHARALLALADELGGDE